MFLNSRAAVVYYRKSSQSKFSNTTLFMSYKYNFWETFVCHIFDISFFLEIKAWQASYLTKIGYIYLNIYQASKSKIRDNTTSNTQIKAFPNRNIHKTNYLKFHIRFMWTLIKLLVKRTQLVIWLPPVTCDFSEKSI